MTENHDPDNTEALSMAKPTVWQRFRSGFILVALLSFLAAIIAPNFQKISCGGQHTGCKSNLKNLGTAMEMYSTDNQGAYPSDLNALTPSYLLKLPICPLYEQQTYRLTTGPDAAYNTQHFKDYYLLECVGELHEAYGCPPDHPKYSALQGLMEGRDR